MTIMILIMMTLAVMMTTTMVMMMMMMMMTNKVAPVDNHRIKSTARPSRASFDLHYLFLHGGVP